MRRIKQLRTFLFGLSIAVSFGVGAFAQTYDTFDSDSVATVGVTFSNGNKTVVGSASSNAASQVAQTVEGKSSGKWYVEFTYTTASASNDAIGLVPSWGIGSISSNQFIGSNTLNLGTHEVGWGYFNFGAVYHLQISQTVVNCPSYTTGDVIGLAIDLTNKRLWFRKNTGSWCGTSGTPNPVTNTGGFDLTNMLVNSSRVYPAVNLSGNPHVTANFGASAFTGTVPSGFTSGWTNTTAGTYWGTFATTGFGTVKSFTAPPNTAQVTKWVASLSGSVNKIIIPFIGAGPGPANVKGLVYDATGAGGLPGALIATSTNVVNGTPYGEQELDFTGIPFVNGTTYWIGYISSAAVNFNIINAVPLTTGIANSTAGTFASPPTTFGTPSATDTGRFPMIAVLGSSSSSSKFIFHSFPP